MSLHKFAEQVAANGRGDDSLLVHMTPDEVQRLQKFAEANGRTMTINPTTGLPEAGFLSDLFKAVAPIALGAFLGPGAFGIAGLGLGAGTAGLITGGLTTLATGSLSRGLMAGLGAYGGAGMAEGLSNLGAGELAQGQISANMPTLAENATQAQIDVYTQQVKDLQAAGLQGAKMMPLADKLSAGVSSAMASPTDALAFAKQNMMPLAAAAAPIMAGAMVPTTTQMPTTAQTPSMIRQKVWNGRGYDEVGPVDASKFAGHSFSDIYKGYNGGGIVALANGGAPGYADGGPPTMLSAEDLFAKTGSWEAAAAARDAQNNALNQYNWQQAAAAQQAPAAQIQAAPPAAQAQAQAAAIPAPVTPSADNWWASQPGGLDAMYDTINKQIAANPNLTDAQVDAAMKQYGISSQDVHNALQKGGGSQAEEWSLGSGNMGLSGLNTNINDWLAKARRDPTFNAKTGLQQQEAARAAMGTVNMNEADVLRATGRTIAELFPSTLTKPVSVVPTGYYGNDTGNPLTKTPGDITTNADGTVTVHPNIPGRPPGGFTGMGQVVDTYTAGGGRTGYVPKAPTTMAEFDQMYNKQTGDSAAAYDYLIGKGAGTADAAKYPTRPTVAQVAKPYDEAVLGYPAAGNKKYIFTNGKYIANPDYVPVGRDSSGKVTYGMSSKDIKSSLLNQPLQGQALYDWAQTNNLSAQQIADATGMSLSEVYAQFRAGSQAKAATDKTTADKAAADAAANTSTESSSGTGGDAAGGLLSSKYAVGGMSYAVGGGIGSLGSYSDGGRLLRGPGDGVSDSIPATIGAKGQPARLADGEFVVPARIVSELGNGSTEAGAKKLYAMMDRVQKARGKTTGKNKVAANTRADQHLPA